MLAGRLGECRSIGDVRRSGSCAGLRVARYPGSYLNGVYESRPLPYAESAYGLPETGQEIINIARRQLAAAEVAERRPHRDPVTGLAVQPQRLPRVAGRARMVPLALRGGRPGAQEVGGQAGFAEAAGQAQALLEERPRGVGLPLAQQDPGLQTQHIGDQVLIAGRAGNGQRRRAIPPFVGRPLTPPDGRLERTPDRERFGAHRTRQQGGRDHGGR